jgi:CRP-like cAMP-binding protein
VHVAETLKYVFHPSSPPADALPQGRAVSQTDDGLLKVLPFVKALSPREHEVLLKVGRLHEVKRGHRLLARGGAATPLFVVVRGALEAMIELAEGKERLSIRGPGRWVGHESCMSGVPQPYSVLARESSVLLAIDRGTLDSLYAERDSLSMRLLEQICASVTEQFNHDTSDLFKRNAERLPMEAMDSEEIRKNAQAAVGH